MENKCIGERWWRCKWKVHKDQILDEQDCKAKSVIVINEAKLIEWIKKNTIWCYDSGGQDMEYIEPDKLKEALIPDQSDN